MWETVGSVPQWKQTGAGSPHNKLACVSKVHLQTSVHDLLCPSQTEVLPLKTGGFTTQNLLHCMCLYSSLLARTNSVKQIITNITMCSSLRCYAASLAVSLLGIPAKTTNFPVLWRWCDIWYRISATTRWCSIYWWNSARCLTSCCIWYNTAQTAAEI